MKLILSALLAVLPLHCDPSPTEPTPELPAQQCTGESRDAVNALQYSYRVLEPVDAAFRMVAADCGWTQESIDEWTPFLVYDVIAKESGGCWNIRRGVVFANGGLNCEIAWKKQKDGTWVFLQGRYSDAGFGQLISIHYQTNPKNPHAGWLCTEDGLCSADDIIAEPYTSMQALVRLVGGSYSTPGSGKQGWCYNAKAIKYHPGCKTAPKGVPTLV